MTLMVSCREVTLPEPSTALRVRRECPPQSGVDFFYPPGAVYEKNLSRDEEQRAMASRFLRAAGVPSLSCGDSVVEGYRLLLMPSYDPAIVLTLSLVNGRWRIDAAEFSDPRTGSTWKVTHRASRVIPDEEILQFLEAVERAKFWLRPAWKESTTQDAATWMIEGRRRTGYRVVTMLDPVDYAFQEVALRFFSFAHIPIPPSAR